MRKFLTIVLLLCTWGLSLVCVYQNVVIQCQQQKIQDEQDTIQFLIHQPPQITVPMPPPEPEHPQHSNSLVT